jgi:hypothetical protein
MHTHTHTHTQLPNLCRAQWYIPVIPAPALGRLRQEGCKFEANLGLQSESLSQK